MLERMNKQTCLLTPVAFESPIRKFKLIGEYIYSSHEDGTIRRWDTVPDSVKCTTIFPGWGKPLTAFEVSGNYIYAASEKFLTTWNIKYQRVEHMSDVYERIRQILVSSSSLFVKCKKSVTQLNLKTHETINVVYTSAEKFGSTIIKEPYLFLGQKFVKEIMKWDFSTNKVSFWDASIINQWAIEDNAVDKVILLNENIYTCHRTGRIKKWTLNGERLATIDLSINILDIQSLISLSKRICAFTSDYKRYDFDDSKDDPKGFDHSLTQVKSGGRIRSVIWKEGRAYVLARDNVVTVYDYAADQKAITLQIGKALKESPSGSFLYEQALKRYNALPVSEENKIADCLHF
jgi:hypothetical protein